MHCISPLENMKRVLEHKEPAYIPFQLEAVKTVFHRDAQFYARNGIPNLDEWFDAWGVKFTIPENLSDDSGFPIYHPLTSLDALDSFPWPDPDDKDIMAAAEEEIKKIDRDQYLIAGMNPGILFVRSWLLYGMDNLLMATILEQKKVEHLLDKITDYQITIAKQYVRLGIDIAHMGDDIGTTKALFMNPELWRKLVKPRLKKIIDEYKKGGCYIYFHSCGRIMDIVDDIIELGIDILNPLQASANDFPELRNRTKRKVILHGGLDCDKLIRGSEKEIRQMTLDTIVALGSKGEYVADADQHLPFPDKTMKIVKETIRKYGRYPIKIGTCF